MATDASSGNSKGQMLQERLQEIAKCSSPGPGVTRLPFSKEHKEANKQIKDWMEKAGLNVQLNAAGTLVGTKKSANATKSLIFGSHQDSIHHGGKYDGILGVALPILALESFKDKDLPFHIEVHAFADEEGVRFPTALLGSRALAGTFNPADFDLADSNGESLGQALTQFGGDPNEVAALNCEKDEILAYHETHIEQGPVLERQDLPLGIVTSICGIERWQIEVLGETGHAGTVPMALRQDALAASAEIIVAVESFCQKQENLLGTIGKIENFPNAVNAIPGKVQFSLELRSPNDDLRQTAGQKLADKIADIAQSRNVKATAEKTYAQPAAQCDTQVNATLANAVQAEGIDPFHLASGATHDASAMADLCPISMLFVRCKGGLSHHPNEFVSDEDLDLAVRAVENFIAEMAAQQH